MEESLAKLAALGIETAPLPGVSGYVLCARGEYGALVSFGAAGFGRVGSSGRITERGLALLVWRGGQAFFVSKGSERPAGDGEVEALREFMSALEGALGGR